jgi:hypothetical protein
MYIRGTLLSVLVLRLEDFSDAAWNLIATILFRNFFFCFSFAVNPRTSVDHLLFRASSDSLDVTVGV